MASGGHRKTYGGKRAVLIPLKCFLVYLLIYSFSVIYTNYLLYELFNKNSSFLKQMILYFYL